MYFNDVHIIYYVIAIIVGGIIGQIVDYCSKCFIKEEKIFKAKTFKEYIKVALPNYLLIFAIAAIYAGMLYKFGIDTTNVLNNVDIIKYALLVPMLACAFMVDFKIQIIPNRLNLLMLEIGLVFVFIYGFSNINMALDMLLGMFAGGGIFLIITLIGGLIAGKEAMGLGDVKLMGAMGLFFGLTNIIIIAVLSFLIGAIASIIILLCRRKKADQYIPFGPFIVIGAIIVIFVPASVLIDILMTVFSLGLNKR